MGRLYGEMVDSSAGVTASRACTPSLGLRPCSFSFANARFFVDKARRAFCPSSKPRLFSWWHVADDNLAHGRLIARNQ